MPESQTPDRKATVLLLLAVAGFVDAIGLAELGQYFVAYMSGNTTTVGLHLAYGDRPGVLLPLGLVALFVGGAALGTLVADRAGRGAVALLLLVVAMLLALAYAAFGTGRPALAIVPLPVAMGVANLVTVRQHSGTTFATGTLVRIGSGLAGLGRGTTTSGLLLDIAMWVALLVGGYAGALARLRFGAEALLGPVAVLVLLGLAELAFGFTATRRARSHR